MNRPSPTAANSSAELAGRGIKPLVSLRAHRRLAALAFAIVLLLALPLAWIKGAPHYQAASVVQVTARYMKNLKDDNELDFQSNSQYRQFVEHQAKSVVRYDVLRDALASLPASSRWRTREKTERRAIERLQESLAVLPVPDTYLMRIQLEDGRGAELAELVNAITLTYIARMQSEQVFGSNERVHKLDRRQAELLKAIAEKSERRTALARELGVASFQENDANPYDKLLADTRARLAEARAQRMAAEAKLEAFRKHSETDTTTRSIQENVLNDPGLNSLKATLNARRAQLVTSVSGLDKRHPAYEAAQAELAIIDGEIARQASTLQNGVKQSLERRHQANAEQSRRLEADLGAELNEQESRSATYARLFNDALSLNADLAEHRKELDQIRERINFLTLESGSFGFVRLVSAALPPEIPFGPGRKKLLLFALLAALAAGALAPVLRDALDRRIHTVNDVERIVGVPPLGSVVERDGEAANLFADDQLRRIASGLIRSRESHGTQTFAFCGVKSGAGTTTLVLQLADTLSRLGFPTLAVEANGYRPDPRFAGAASGLADYLASGDERDLRLPRAEDGQAQRLGIGAGGERRQISRLDRIQSAQQAWQREYAFALVDLPALLVAADAELLAQSIGHVVLVVEAEGVVTGEVARASRLLQNLDPESVGVIVNRVRPYAGGGYMQGLLTEHLTGRKLGDFPSPPAWRVALDALRARLTQRSASARTNV